MKRVFIFAGLMLAGIGIAQAGEADVVEAKAHKMGDGTWRISATVRHNDSGWDHYADRWDVVGPDGSVLATRVLAHPHVDEQPFTRSKAGIAIAAGVSSVTIRAHDKVHGYGGKEFQLELK